MKFALPGAEGEKKFEELIKLSGRYHISIIYDLKCLFEMLEEDPNNSRHVYYIAQTYNLLENHEKAAEYFYKRAFHQDEGFLQEKYDALFDKHRS